MRTNMENEDPKKIVKELFYGWHCLMCKRRVGINELYGAFGMCSECLATEGFDEHHGG